MRISARLGWSVASTLAICALCGGARAESDRVRATLSSREAYVGAPIHLEVEIENARSHSPPVAPNVPGADIESAGAPRRSSQTRIMGGRVDQRSSVTYLWQITPLREGVFTIPALDVEVDGQTETTAPLRFVATKSETGDLLYVEVSGQKEKVYVGQSLPLTLKIWLKPYRDAEFDLTLSEGNMWQMIAPQSNWGAFSERMQSLREENKRPRGEEVLRADSGGVERSYFVYEIEAAVCPKHPGQIDAGEVRILVNYPTQLARSRDPFSSFFDDDDFPFGQGALFSGRDFSPFRRDALSIAASRPLVAEASVTAIDVTPIPSEGRPADYRGAVGRFSIMTQATPTSVAAGDPITLHIGVTGTGPMELVPAPPLASLPELTGDFRAPDEPLAGVVQDQAKLFTVNVRPRREGVARIPPIPLSFFDPEKEAFVTVYSDPIPIQVGPADTLALDSIVGGTSGAGLATEASESGGDTAAGLQLENFSGDDLLHSAKPVSLWGLTLAFLAPPLMFCGLAIARNARRFGGRFATLGFGAARSARRALDKAQSPRDVSRAVLGYLAKRLERSPATLTRREAVVGLRAEGGGDISERVDALLGECERRAFAGAGGAVDGALIEQARECVHGLSRRRSVTRARHPRGAVQ